MSTSLAISGPQSPIERLRRYGLVAPLMLGLVACGPPAAELIAEERAAPEAVATSTVRGRVRVVGGRVVSDLGTPLRGVVVPVDVGWTQDDFNLMTRIADTTGLNTLHVYLENYAVPTGAMQAQADALVALTAQAGLYLIIGIGGGLDADDHPGNGWFSLPKIVSFWELYAARYANSSHVLFEIQNNPEINCSRALRPDTISMERTAYQLIRERAPDSHVLFFSTSAVPDLAAARQTVDGVRDLVDFTNESFAMHAEPNCVPPTGYADVVTALTSAGVPVILSALPSEDWEPVVATAETLRVSWLHHRWLADESSLQTLTAAITAAGISWCPDRGSFPQRAEDCR